MKRTLISCLLVMVAVACGDDDDDLPRAGNRDGGSGPREPGVCDLNDCPESEMGNPCCTPLAQCGFDPTGLGLNCVANPGELVPDRECNLEACPTPPVGQACCTPLAACGFDPFQSSLICFGYPATIPDFPDAGVCEVENCEWPPAGFPCCLANGQCGWDPWEAGVCFSLPPEPPVPDAGDAGAFPPISTTPPDDPSVDGQCPSFLGAFGPVWGCCSDFGVCGTFAADDCLLPIGAPLTVDPESDAGALEGFLRCDPPDPT